jgi:hypothetical protein
MTNRIGFLGILVSIVLLLNSIPYAITLVEASSGLSVYVSEGYDGMTDTTYVNQPLPITATPQDGVPPYTFQWYVDGSPISEATNATFTFCEKSPGFYRISLSIEDSEGNGEYDLFLPGGIWIYVKPLPESALTPTPTPQPPTILIISPSNSNYSTNAMNLNFSISLSAQWIAYSLDNQANVTLEGNSTLTDLSNGQHNITIYANDTSGVNAIPQTVTFTVNLPTTSLTIETIAMIATVVSIVSVGGGLIYLKAIKYRTTSS